MSNSLSLFQIGSYKRHQQIYHRISEKEKVFPWRSGSPDLNLKLYSSRNMQETSTEKDYFKLVK